MGCVREAVVEELGSVLDEDSLEYVCGMWEEEGGGEEGEE